MHRRMIFVAACTAALGCTLKAPTTTPKPSNSAEGVVRGGIKGTIVKAPSPVPDAFFGRSGGGLVSNNAGNIVSNNGSSLVGVVKAPAGLISNNGSTVISNNGAGYHLLATSQVPVAGVEVLLVSADGTPATDAKGQVISAKTDARGQYKLPFSGSTANLVVRVALPAQKGSLLAFVAKGEKSGDRTVDVDLDSTYVMGYILGQYVKGDQKVLEKLPGDVEAETRAKMAQALDKSTAAPPTALTSDQIAQAVNDLRAQDTTIDAQMEKVKRILLVGLSDQGAGQPALSVETDAVGLAVSPTGEIFYAGLNTARVWRRDAQGLLRPYAGNGTGVPSAAMTLAPDQPAPGDGGPATATAIYPAAIAFDKAGTLYIGDAMMKRVRKVDATGTITTLAGQADWKDLAALAVAPDGAVLVATKTALDRIAPDKTITRLAGGTTAGTPTAGATSALRFKGISDLAIDPTQGDILALDASGLIVRIAGATATIEAGTGTPGFGGDNGPAASAAFSGTGGLDFGADGALWMADLGNRRLRRIQSGTITTLAGDGSLGFKGDAGPAAQAGMVNPRSVCVAPDGAVYTADAGYVRKLANGTLTTVVGQLTDPGPQPLAKIQLRNPKSLWYDAATNALLISELWRVRRWNLATDTVETITSAGLTGAAYTDGCAATAPTLFNFYGLAQSPDGSMTFTADDAKFQRRMVRQKDGKLTTLAGDGTDTSLFGLLLALDAPAKEIALQSDAWPVAVKGDKAYYGLFMTGMSKAIVAEVTPGGAVTELTRVPSAVNLTGLAVSPDGASLYIGALSRIDRYDFATQQVTTIATDGGPASPDALGIPSGFAWDARGNVYFADYAAGRVRRIDKATGAIIPIAGKGTPLLNQDSVDDSLAAPWGVALDKAGNLYISDLGANQIKKIPADKLP